MPTESEGKRCCIRRYPISPDMLEGDDMMRAALGEGLAREYLAVKRPEPADPHTGGPPTSTPSSPSPQAIAET